MPIDPARFRVRGWLWLEPPVQHDVAAVEVWSAGALLGETGTFKERPDVTAAFALPPGLNAGFELFVQHPIAATLVPFEIELRARLRDGSRTPPLCSDRIIPLSRERHPLGMLRFQLPPHALGIEIGAHALPVPGLAPFYTDTVAEYAGSPGRVDFLADALALPLPDDCLDYLCSSHVLEHLANPLAALHEWHRVLRPGGWLYLVVPDKRFTFDEPRAVTSCEHLMRDFVEARTAATSVEHVDEFIYQTNWGRLRPNATAEEWPIQQAAAHQGYLAAIAAGRPIDIHYHTFTPDSMQEVLRAAGFIGGRAARFEIFAQAERYPPDRADGIALLLRKRGEARPGGPRDTFTLSALDPAARPLPLVCPISRRALRCETQPDGSRVLIAKGGAQRYVFADARPALLPPPDARPTRPWSSRPWRILYHTATKLRLAFSPEAH